MTDTTNAAKMPPEIAKAIIKVMGGVKKLGKTDRNDFDKYDFTSIDKFLEQVNPLCAEAGLIIVQDEIKREVLPGKNNTPWLHFDFEFWLAHESGAFWDKPLHRGVMVPANGAQAFGSAQSFSLKQFMRSMFQIPTGDKDDADFEKREELPNGAKGGKKTATADPAQFIETKLREAAEAGSMADVAKVWTAQQPAMRRLNADQIKHLECVKDELKATAPQGESKQDAAE